AYHFAGLVHGLVRRLVHRLFQTVHDFVDFALSDRSRLVSAATDEAHYAGSFLDQMPGVVVEHHLDEHIAGEKFALAAALLAGAHFHHLFGRYQYLTEQIGIRRQRDALFERLLDLALKSGISVHYVPALIVCSRRHIQPLRLWSEADEGSASIVFTSSADKQRDQPAHHGIESPQQDGYENHHQHHDQRGVNGFLTRRPNHLADFRPCFPSQLDEGLAFGGLRS